MDDLLRLVPPVRRIRGNRLYLQNGKRILDMWLDNGRGLLCELEKPVKKLANNASDKGLLRPYPGLFEHRLKKALQHTWPGYNHVKFFRNIERVANAYKTSITDCLDEQNGICLLRPFAVIPVDCVTVIPLIPISYEGICVMSKKPEPAIQDDLLPQQFFLAASRALYNLPLLTQKGYTEQIWSSFDKLIHNTFKRNGPWLFPILQEEQYTELFTRALDKGILLSPYYNKPSIVPFGFSKGEMKKIAEIFKKE